MKRSLWWLMIVYAGCATSGTQSGSPASPPSATGGQTQAAMDSEPVTEGDVTSASVRGVRVVVKRVPGAEFVAGQLSIRGGVRNWEKADSGIERLAFAVSAGGGTESLNKDAFTRRLATLGSTLTTLGENDFSAFLAKSLKENWGETFHLMVDAFLRPALPASEVELQRQRQLSELRHELEDPDGQLRLLLQQTMFKGHPYEKRAAGTVETVSKLRLEQLDRHLRKLRETKRLLLVVVGDVEPVQVIEQTREAFRSIPAGDYAETPLPPLKAERAQLTVMEKKLPTNYILGVFPAPGWRDPDFPAAMAAITVLTWREWLEVRTKRNLSYAPSAGLVFNTALPRGFLYVTAVDPNTTIQVMYDEARKLQKEPVPASELNGDISVFTTGLLMTSESTDGQAVQLSDAEIFGGDWRLARNLPSRLRSVTSAEVRAFSENKIRNLQIAVLGDPKKIDRGLFSSL